MSATTSGILGPFPWVATTWDRSGRNVTQTFHATQLEAESALGARSVPIQRWDFLEAGGGGAWCAVDCDGWHVGDVGLD